MIRKPMEEFERKLNKYAGAKAALAKLGPAAPKAVFFIAQYAKAGPTRLQQIKHLMEQARVCSNRLGAARQKVSECQYMMKPLLQNEMSQLLAACDEVRSRLQEFRREQEDFLKGSGDNTYALVVLVRILKKELGTEHYEELATLVDAAHDINSDAPIGIRKRVRSTNTATAKALRARVDRFCNKNPMICEQWQEILASIQPRMKPAAPVRAKRKQKQRLQQHVLHLPR